MLDAKQVFHISMPISIQPVSGWHFCIWNLYDYLYLSTWFKYVYLKNLCFLVILILHCYAWSFTKLFRPSLFKLGHSLNCSLFHCQICISIPSSRKLSYWYQYYSCTTLDYFFVGTWNLPLRNEQNRTKNQNQNRIKSNQIKPHQLKTEPNKNRTNNVVVVWFSKF